MEDRKANAAINVIHCHRSRLQAGRRYGWSQRKVNGEFEFQAFDWPKGRWTRTQRYALEAAAPEERKHLRRWGGTTIANRHDWRRIVREGLREGWYRQEYGVVKSVDRTDDGRSGRASRQPRRRWHPRPHGRLHHRLHGLVPDPQRAPSSTTSSRCTGRLGIPSGGST